MFDRDAYFDILSLVEDESPIDPDAFIKLVTERYELAHASYIDILPGTGSMHLRRSHHNYPAEWTRIYYSRALYRHDVVLHEGMRSVSPLDWPALRKQNPTSEIVFSTAEAYGIPGTGLTLPQVSRGRSCAMFSVSAHVPPRGWPSWRRALLRDIQTLAALFHASIQEPSASARLQESMPPELTERESEVLKWSAAGKSYWEISMILGVSERTVRFFMTNARQKLDVVTNTQAVATAIWHGLIPPI
ncbi:MAG TPA: LuxR family transcriptional regulator [Pararhizobium sp.]|nr:LuxR family transcriptional regulator [Pararhizobium sp.]